MADNQAITIYETKVLPYLNYADILSIGMYKGSLKKRKNNKIEPFIFAFTKTHVQTQNQLHIETGISFLKDRHHMHLLNYMLTTEGKQDHQNSMSGRTRLFDAVVFDNITPLKTAVDRSAYC